MGEIRLKQLDVVHIGFPIGCIHLVGNSLQKCICVCVCLCCVLFSAFSSPRSKVSHDHVNYTPKAYSIYHVFITV